MKWAIERNIRAIKRQLVVKEELMQGASEKERKRLQLEYDKLAYDFAKEHGLTPQYGRKNWPTLGKTRRSAQMQEPKIRK